MVVDTSAFVAMLDEPDGPAYLQALVAARRISASALTTYETRVALGSRRHGRRRFKPGAEGQFATLLSGFSVEVVPFTEAHAVLAHQAYLRFGRGHHPAGLNLADCAAYALAQQRREPLLFKGEDFKHTDVEIAVVPTGAVPR